MTNYEAASLILDSFTAIAAFAVFFVYYRQLKVMAKQLETMQNSSQAEGALALVNYLQTSDVRAARHCVREVLAKKHLNDWNAEERRNAAIVTANYDVVAALLKAGVAPVELIATNWASSIKHCYEILQPFIAEYRNMTYINSSYWSNFEWLYIETTKSNGVNH
jgi:hypothetical protein